MWYEDDHEIVANLNLMERCLLLHRTMYSIDEAGTEDGRQPGR